ncbi:MAG: putative ATP-dependent ligase [Archaeoglobi archaeon]|nr:putative ATP-dependent ligase [Archaeoglobi archaeon]
MIESILSDILGIEEYRVRGFLRRRVISRIGEIKGAELYRFEKDGSGYEQGTVVVLGDEPRIIRGYPKIRRALLLERTLERHFELVPELAVEEKMNGYNVRICMIENELVALTRGGFPCPYTTHKAKKLINEEFFRDHPDLVLCAEAVGPENPYVPKDIYGVKSLDFFVFDIMREDLRIPVKDKIELCESYGIKMARLFGFFRRDQASEEIKRIVRELGREGREGVVIKDPEMLVEPLKYTSSESNCSDLSYGFRFYSDYAVHFFLSRVIREAFQSFEFGEDEEERRKRAERIGKSILEPMVETIERVSKGERIAERITLRVDSPDIIIEFQKHLRRMGIDASFGEIREENGEYLVEMFRYYNSTTDKTKAILEGRTWS